MGFLEFSEKPLTLEEVNQIKRDLKKDGIIQLLNLLKKKDSFNLKEEELKYGYEIELSILKKEFDPVTKKITYKFETDTKDMKVDSKTFKFVDEEATYMLEAIPKQAHASFVNGCGIYRDLKRLMPDLHTLMKKDNEAYFAPVFPKLGMQSIKHQFLEKDEKFIDGKHNQFTQSEYQDDRLINDHYRFVTLNKHVRERRDEKPNILIPLYQDSETDMKSILENEKIPGQIHLDAFNFGMGNNSLQITFGSKDLDESRWLYDQFSVLSSIMLAFSAATPVVKGKLSGMDTRWALIEQSTDDRTKNERKEGAIAKGRYSTISYYIANDKRNKKKYNDLPYTLNKSIKKFMKNEAKNMGVELDKKLLNHYSYLWVRDPLVVFPSRLKVDNEKKTDHFENLQSTNWNNVRLKPPPTLSEEEFKKSKVGWRTEFRSLDSQITIERTF